MFRLILALLSFVALAQGPNIVVIFADDMGYGDMSCNGHPTIKTPHLDRMAYEGQKWTNFYVAASVCTPSRAGLLTGRYPIRSGMCSSKRGVLFPDSKGGLPASEVTIPEILKSKGYATGMVGKWHLGHHPQFLPTNNGFDSWYGIPYSNDMDRNDALVTEANKGRDWNWHTGNHWLFPKNEYWDVPLMDGEKILERAPDQALLTKNYTKKSVEFIRANKDKPFFLYLAHSMPHVPLFRSAEFANVSTAGLYGDVIEELDWSVGQVLDTLRREGLAEKTLVVFTSDNGPWLLFKTQGGISGPLRDGKGTTWEGGMREPTIFWWPGTVQRGIVHDMGSTLDFMATFASLTGATLPDTDLDSHDLSATLKTQAKGPRDSMIFYYGSNVHAVRIGKFKTHFTTRSWGKPFEHHDPPPVFNLDLDPGETYNVAKGNPAVIAKAKAFRDQFVNSFTPGEDQLSKR